MFLAMFEAKSYNQVRIGIGAANCIFALLILIFGYACVISEKHIEAIDSIMKSLIDNPVFALLPGALVISVVWAYLTTVLLRIHDRFYEPILVKWRASYDTDFILRSICRKFEDKLPENFFNNLYFSKRKRDSVMYRLFYSIVGDSKKDHEELLERFYTIIRNYWIVGLAEIYAVFALLVYAIYGVIAHIRIPSGLVFALLIIAIICRIATNCILDRARPITSEQVHVILSSHSSKVEEAIKKLTMDKQSEE